MHIMAEASLVSEQIGQAVLLGDVSGAIISVDVSIHWTVLVCSGAFRGFVASVGFIAGADARS